MIVPLSPLRQKTCFVQWTHPSEKQVFSWPRTVLRKKVGRRDAGRTHQQVGAPRYLLADFPQRIDCYHKSFLLYQFHALSADRRKRRFPERHFQPFGHRLFASFSLGEKKRILNGRSVAASPASEMPVLFHREGKYLHRCSTEKGNSGKQLSHMPLVIILLIFIK